MDIIQVNINRYVRKYNRYKSGLLDTSCGIYNDLVSNFVEHCNNNIDCLQDYTNTINYLIKNLSHNDTK